MLLEQDAISDFKMMYFNADGRESTMCGNGGRCLVAFAKQLGLIQKKAVFNAVDGLHTASIDENQWVHLQMKDVQEVNEGKNYTFLNTGSPHHVEMVDNLRDLEVQKLGAEIRYSGLYGKEGSNVNFVTQIDEVTFAIRTYERGVEAETLSCGTGATAVAIAMFHAGKTNANEIKILVEGGELEVSFEKNQEAYQQVFLKGPATFVFEGKITLTDVL
jgi:diaminopimelate epimerase